MKTKPYIAPDFVVISLDNEISLILSSTPPIGPGESGYEPPDHQEQTPYE